MSFESRIGAFAERFLSDRTFQLIVAPALADLQFEQSLGRRRRAAHRVAVLKALAGGIRDDVRQNAGSFVVLMLLPACYHILLLVICFGVFSITISTDFVVVATVILILSFGPVMVCFWPERQTAPPGD
jgi:hypothetical protein